MSVDRSTLQKAGDAGNILGKAHLFFTNYIIKYGLHVREKRNELRLILYTIHLLSRSLRYFFLRILAQRNVICPTDRAIKSVKERYYKKKLLVATRSILAKKMGPKQIKLFMGFGGK